MNLKDYLKNLSSPLRSSTLCFLIKDDQVLLAMKKRGFGQGKWNGVGGKKNDNETIEEAAKRETHEEINVIVEDLQHAAILNFYFLKNPDWNQQVHVFLVNTWKNDPSESEEMKPQWFYKNKLPLKDMWPDDEYWLPLVLDNKKVVAKFLFGEGDVILDQKVEIL